MQDDKTASADKSDWSEMMRASLHGDAAAYRHLLSEMVPVLRGIVRSRASGMGMDWCEDVVQDTLMAIHLKRGTWKPELPLRPWVYAIARHKIVDAFRRSGREISMPVEAFADLPQPEPDIDPMESRDAETLIDRLPERDAALLRCLALDGHGNDECGRRLGLAPGALRVALHRALKRLAAIRREEGL
ncbi:sigma-70 family RNA polymerase sigma factor [Paracoccus onubensis]|uniref:Sigma-70 family RNA polymerase sigma factor n=1 Tax=Paracoccus onubensis TaxID=1675788 RepID=A0A418SP40_9RHOB|nr:sigma-70 family RNA polymerase sigma factor [Paracoccus onubensis]RJE82682.1 sigma-70 family RNA polymerase sigma factor [Paracoccus onubensis]